MTTKIGTPYYVSPEILEGKYDNGCDIWSIGIISYIMLCGYPPFNAENENVLFRKILCCDYEFRAEDWSHISEEAKGFIKQCLQPISAKRLTAEQAIIHPWLLKHSKETLQKNVSPNVLYRLRLFKKPCILQQEVLKVLGTLLPYKEVKDIKDTFYALDKNLSGGITYEELKQAFQELQIAPQDSKQLEFMLRDIFFRIDTNNDEEISYSEFLTACLDPVKHLTK